MKWSDLPLDPSPRILRQFCAAGAVVLGACAIWQAWREHPARAAILGIGALAFAGVGLLRPALGRPVFVALTVIGFPIGWVVSLILLGAIFYGVFTPLGLLFRAMGRDALRLRAGENSTYWTPKPQARNIRQYFREY